MDSPFLFDVYVSLQKNKHLSVFCRKFSLALSEKHLEISALISSLNRIPFVIMKLQRRIKVIQIHMPSTNQ